MAITGLPPEAVMFFILAVHFVDVMKTVLLLSGGGTDSKYFLPIYRAVQSTGDELIVSHGATLETGNPDLIVLYGYRQIVPKADVKKWQGKLINLHISYLPYNRGAHPNLWSWYDNTPKGVSIHYVDSGIDTGPLIVRRAVDIPEFITTLKGSYEQLQVAMGQTFFDWWPTIREGYPGEPQESGGSEHTSWQSTDLMKHFPLGFDTPVQEIAEFGRERRAAVRAIS